MRHIELHTTWDDIWGAFEVAVQQGKVGYIGSSNFAGWHLAVTQAAAKERHFLGLVSEQHKYNLLTREPELEVLPSAEALDRRNSLEPIGRRSLGTKRVVT